MEKFVYIVRANSDTTEGRETMIIENVFVNITVHTTVGLNSNRFFIFACWFTNK